MEKDNTQLFDDVDDFIMAYVTLDIIIFWILFGILYIWMIFI